MNRTELVNMYRAVSIYGNAKKTAAPLYDILCEDDGITCAARIFSAVAEAGCDSTGEWLTKLVLADDNAFSRAAAKGERISPRIEAQVKRELETFKLLSLIKPSDFTGGELFPAFGFGGFSPTYRSALEYYEKHCCGVLSSSCAFEYRAGCFVPVKTPSTGLSDLKNYAEEKSEVIKNTENFINGLPAFHTLLYGDRGTGKSTTVRALAHDYGDRLKVIEIGKNAIDSLADIFAALDGYKQRFILFADDLGFEDGDERIEAFKAALDGSLRTSGNVLLYCTSNRRHLIRENEREVKNRNDETQAELALFDRFGLVVTYVTPDKAEFLDIFKQILRSRSVKWRDEYAQIAELAALKKGGRSPRVAKQIADLIESAQTDAERRQ